MLIRKSIFLLCFLVLTPPVIAQEFIELGLTEKQLGYRNKHVDIPLQLEHIPEKPRLALKFKVIDASVCHDTYTPTEVYVNGQHLSEINFVNFDKNNNETVNIDIPPAFLRVGMNTIRINSGSCEKAIDVMEFNSIRVYQ